jgi:hypothetical protein
VLRRIFGLCDVESKWKNYHIITFPGQSLSPKTEKLSLEEAMDLLRDRIILELERRLLSE